MPHHAGRSSPFMALALLAACQRGERPSATTDKPTFANPASASLRERGPATFRARFQTSKGDIVVEVHRDWAPLGADRFSNPVRSGHFDGGRFFRVIPGSAPRLGTRGYPP